jgi:hypothetical protein
LADFVLIGIGNKMVVMKKCLNKLESLNIMGHKWH